MGRSCQGCAGTFFVDTEKSIFSVRGVCGSCWVTGFCVAVGGSITAGCKGLW